VQRESLTLGLLALMVAATVGMLTTDAMAAQAPQQ
jgi:hypothetical protein